MRKRIVSLILLFAMLFTMIPSLHVTSYAVTAKEDLYNAVKAGEIYGYNTYLAWYHTIYMGEGRDESLHEYCESLLYNQFAKVYVEEKMRTGFLGTWAALNGTTIIEVEEDLYFALLLKMVSGDIESSEDDPYKTYEDSKALVGDILTPLLEELCYIVNAHDIDECLEKMQNKSPDELEEIYKEINEYIDVNSQIYEDWEEVGGILDNLFQVLDSTVDAIELIEQMSAINSLAEDSANMKAVLWEMSQNSDDWLIRNAAGELWAYMGTPDYASMLLQLVAQIMEGSLDYVKDKLIDAMWDGISKYNAGFKIGMEIADACFDVTGEAESIYTIIALTKIEDAIFDASINLRNDFINNQNIDTATTYMASLEMCYRFAIITNTYVNDHLETVFKSGLIKELIKDQETYQIYKDTLKTSQKNLQKSYNAFYSAPRSLYDEIKSQIGSSFTITYDANGGTYAPGIQTKEFGVSAYITYEEPVYSGYRFVGWAEKKTAKTYDYLAGDAYTMNEDITLYAVWRKENTVGTEEPSVYSIRYIANAPVGTVSNIPNNQTKQHDKEIGLSSQVPVRDGYTFLGWSMSFTAEEADKDYAPGSFYSNNSNLMLYAVWKNNDSSEDGLPGDIDGDNKVDDKDLIIFRQYLDGKDVSVDEQALNVDGIGEVDENDYSILFKYLTGWNVKIYYGGEPAEETVFTVTSAENENVFEKGEIEVANETASFYWTVSSSHDWVVISSEDWLSFSTLTGKEGITNLKITVTGQTNDSRDAIVTFTVNGETKKVVITQNKATFAINHAIVGDILAKDAVELTNSVGQEMNWTISSSHDWEVTETEGTWYSIDKTKGIAGENTNFKITTTAYSKEGKNEGEITFKVNGDVYSVVIYQQGPEKIKSLEAPIINIKVNDEIIRNTVYWNAVDGANGYYVYRKIKDSQIFWGEPIMDTKATSINDDTCKYDITYEYMVRAYYDDGINIITSEDSNVVESCIEDTSLKVDKTSIDLLWNKGNEAVFTIISKREITFKYENDCEEWLDCSIDGDTLGCRTKTVNYSDEARVGKIRITNGINYAIVTVNQSAIKESKPTISLVDNIGSTPILDGDNIGTREDTLSFRADTLNVRRIYVQIIPVNGTGDPVTDVKVLNGGTEKTDFNFSLAEIDAGEYKVIVYSSNSPIENDPTAQKPKEITFYFTKENSFRFEVTHPTAGDILENQPIEVYNGANTDMNWTVNSSHEWSASITKGSWFEIKKTSDTNLRITTKGYASNGGRNEGTIKFTVNGKTYSVNIYQQSKSVSKPQNVTAELNKNDSVTVSWDSVTNATGYRVYRKTVGTNAWTEITDTTKTYVNDFSVEKGNVYYYYVEVYVKTASGEISAESETVTVSIDEEFYFEVTHPNEGNVLENQPIELANEVGAAMNWTVNSSHEWAASATKGNWFEIKKTSDTNLRITTKGYASNGGRNEGTIKFTVNGKTYSVNIYQQSEEAVVFTITHPEVGDILENQPIEMHNGTSYMTWTVNSSHSWSVKSSASWCTFAGTGSTSFTHAAGEYKLVLDIDGGTSSEREATLTFTVNGEKIKVKIYQENITYPQTLEEAENMVRFTTKGKSVSVKKGYIRQMSQMPKDPNYCISYWKKGAYDLTDSSGGMCTRAVYSMALSYLGIDCTPVKMSEMYGNKYLPDPANDGTNTYSEITKKLGNIKALSGSLDELFDNYASNSNYSPVYFYFDKGGSNHCILIIGKKDENTYYAIDPSYGYVDNVLTHVIEVKVNFSTGKITGCTWKDYRNANILGCSQWKLE